MKLLALALLLAGTSEAAFYCTYSANGLQQFCYDLSKPADAHAYNQYLEDKAEAAIRSGPRAGIFDGPPAKPQTVTSPDLVLPDNGLIIFRVDQVLDGTTLTGTMNFVPQRIRLANVEVSTGQAGEAKKVLAYYASPGTIVYLEMTGKYESGIPTAFVWQINTLMNLLLVERGLTAPTHAYQKYLPELDIAQLFSQKAGLGFYKSK